MKWFHKHSDDAAPRLLSLSPIRNHDSGDPDYSAERYYQLQAGPRRSRLGTYILCLLKYIFCILTYNNVVIFSILAVTILLYL